MARIFGLSMADLERETARFGVADAQVYRDHAISHILTILSERCANELLFFGGTALSRTHLTHARLSEDIDLMARGSRTRTIEHLTNEINRGLLRTHGRAIWNPGFSRHDDVEPAVINLPQGTSIKIQLLDGNSYQDWPVETRSLEQRYADAGPATLTVPTIASFVGWKTAAWYERQAARDLYDLWALADIGAITRNSAELFAQHGPTGGPPRSFMFNDSPSEASWRTQLATQTRLGITSHEALLVVRQAWSSALDEPWGD